MTLGSTSHKLRDACEGPRREMVKKRIRSGGPSADGCENGRAVRRPVRLLLLAFSVLLGACSATAPSPSPLSTSVPTLAPTEGPTPTPALSPGSSGGALDLAMAAAIAEVEAAVPPLRGLELRAEVPNRILDAAGLHAELLRLFDEAATPAEYAAQSRFGERMGLLPAGSDLRALQLALFEEQALGFYDQDTRQMTLVERGSGTFGPLERATLAHEYTHALQDQHFGLADLGLDDLTQGDRALARLALIEGDASLLMQQWAAENLSFADAMKVLLQALDPRQQAVLAGMPPILQRQLMFPYLDGLAFVTGLQAAGGWTAVDAAYSRPPDSTEQILHPEKYTVGEGPVAIASPDELGRLGAGWTGTLPHTPPPLHPSPPPTREASGEAATPPRARRCPSAPGCWPRPGGTRPPAPAAPRRQRDRRHPPPAGRGRRRGRSWPAPWRRR